MGSSEPSISGGDAKGRRDGREESEGEDVTPTAVAKEVIGLRPCARYPNRGRRREPAEGRRREGLSVDEGGDDWRRPSDAAPLSRAPPIREGVSRPLGRESPPTILAAGGDGKRGGAAACGARPLRNSSAVYPRWPFLAPSRIGERERASPLFAPRLCNARPHRALDPAAGEFLTKLQ